MAHETAEEIWKDFSAIRVRKGSKRLQPTSQPEATSQYGESTEAVGDTSMSNSQPVEARQRRNLARP
jgi:hypothetical protein